MTIFCRLWEGNLAVCPPPPGSDTGHHGLIEACALSKSSYLPMPRFDESVDEALSSTVEVALLVYKYHGQAEDT